MSPLTRTARTALLVCALATAAAGCAQTGTGNGTGLPPGGTAGLGASPTPAGVPSTPPPGKPDPEPTQGTPTTAPPAPSGPRFEYFRIKKQAKCPQGTNQFPVPAEPLVVEWKAIGGTEKVALSVDSTMVGSYGTYGPEGTQEFYFSCGGAPNSIEKHSYTAFTVGGGPQRSKSLTAEAKVYEIGQT